VSRPRSSRRRRSRHCLRVLEHSSRPSTISKRLLNQLATATYLDQVLSFSLGDKRLKLGCCESIDQTSLGDNEQENLGAGEYRQFVCL
jgi:hypothetical protein